MPRRQQNQLQKELSLFKNINGNNTKSSKNSFERAKKSFERDRRIQIRAKRRDGKEKAQVPKDTSKYVSGRYIQDNIIEERSYQTDAVECYEQFRNIAVIAKTGVGGKTVIAARIINSFYEREHLGKKVLFLTPEVVLAHKQEEDQISKMLVVLEKTVVTGEIAPEKRIEKYKEADIIFATPQTIMNDIFRERFSMDDVGLVVFDEAHHGTGNYDYVEIAKMCGVRDIERVLLSASLAPTEERMENILDTFRIEKVYTVDENDKDVILHDYERYEESRHALLIEPFYSIRNILKTHIENTVLFFRKWRLVEKEAVKRGYLSEEELKDIKGKVKGINPQGIRREMQRYIYEYRLLKLLWEYIECEGKTIFLDQIQRILIGDNKRIGLISKIRKVNENYLKACGYGDELVFYENKKELDKEIKSLKDNDDFWRIEPKKWTAFWRLYLTNKALLKDMSLAERLTILLRVIESIPEKELMFYKNTPFFFIFKDKGTVKLILDLIKIDIEHPKLNLLISGLRYSKSKDIVFVKYKKMARVIAEEILRELNKFKYDQNKKRVGVFLGKEKGNTRKKQEEIVNKFINGEFDILVSTSVGHEGFNYSCDNAYFYDFTSDPRERIQRKGRIGRHKEGFIIKIKTILPDDNKVSIDQRRDSISIAREKNMQRISREAQGKITKKKITQELELPLFETSLK